jgi:hypothetical protein
MQDSCLIFFSGVPWVFEGALARVLFENRWVLSGCEPGDED